MVLSYASTMGSVRLTTSAISVILSLMSFRTSNISFAIESSIRMVGVEGKGVLDQLWWMCGWVPAGVREHTVMRGWIRLNDFVWLEANDTFASKFWN